jgi:ribosomal protein S26
MIRLRVIRGTHIKNSGKTRSVPNFDCSHAIPTTSNLLKAAICKSVPNEVNMLQNSSGKEF